ncbi:Glu-tRNA(Gln) amidotransferase subunit GatD [Caldiplasma sukawensis]
MNEISEVQEIITFIWKGKEITGLKISQEGELLNVKLKNGYNIIVKPEKILREEKILKNGVRAKSPERYGSGEPVCIISTGGTITSRVDYSSGAVFPSMDIREIAESNPYIKKNYSIEVYDFSSILSENIQPEHWIRMAKTVSEKLNENTGVVISHGTDTMSYSAAALSFLIKKRKGSIVFTGSQRSSDRPSSDSYLNLEAALSFSIEKNSEIGISMHESISDRRIQLTRGVRTRKMHSTRRDAFKSIGAEPLGYYMDGLKEMSDGLRPPDESNEYDQKLESRVGILYFYPGIEPEAVETFIEKEKATIIMGTGLGNVNENLIPVFKRLTDSGKKIVMTTQCIYGEVDPLVYRTGRELKKSGVIYLGDILPETAYVKAMYVLGNYKEEKFEEIMRTNISGEIVQREGI